jgi:hypothetical protein
VRAVHLIALSAFAVLSKNPDYFAVERVQALEVALYGVVVLLVPAAILMALELVVGLIHPKVVSIVHRSVVLVLTFLAVGRALQSPSSFAKVLVALGAAIVFLFAYRAWEPARLFLSIRTTRVASPKDSSARDGSVILASSTRRTSDISCRLDWPTASSAESFVAFVPQDCGTGRSSSSLPTKGSPSSPASTSGRSTRRTSATSRLCRSSSSCRSSGADV